MVAYIKVGKSECERFVGNGFSKFYKLEELFKKKRLLLQSDTLIIRCKLRMLGPKSIQTSEQIFKTEFPIETFTTRLTLHNFSGTTKQNPQIFDLEDKKDLLSLNVSMNRDETFKEQKKVSTIESENPDALKSFLHMVMVKQDAKDAMHISCRIKVLNNNMDVAVDKEVNHLFSKTDAKEEWVLPYFIDAKNLPRDCTENDSLFLEIESTICDRKPFFEQVTDLASLKLKADSTESPLMNDLESLHKTSKVSDVILEVDDKTFPVHKSLLDATSPRNLKPIADSTESPLMNDLEGLHKTSKVSDVILEVDDKTFPVHKSILDAKSPRNLKPIADSKESPLMNDLEGLHKTRNVSDVILEVEDKTFPVHISILAAKSPIFEEIFKGLKNTTNRSQPVIKIDDVNKSIMTLLLKFIYTDTLKELDNISERKYFLLYAAAQKYQILSLLSRCIHFFRKKLSVKYVFNALMMAESWNDSDLKLVALDRFADHYQYWFTSPEWETFIDEHETLAYEVLRHVRFKKIQ